MVKPSLLPSAIVEQLEQLHPSSGAHITVITASDNGQAVSATFRYRGAVGTTPPIIRSTYNCNYSISHWTNRLCYLLLSCSSCFTTTESSRDGLTSARCCNYNYMCSWWWVELPPETSRASSLQKYNKLYIVASRWTVIRIDSRSTDPWT